MKKEYIPVPVDTSEVVLSEELLDLIEQVAENVHNVWARGRISEGWSYGPKIDPENMTIPLLVPYEELTDREKEYDRNTVIETLKLFVKLGCSIIMKKNIRERIEAYQGGEPFIFVSYAHEDSDLVLSIISMLQKRLYRIWYDEGIAPSEEFEKVIFRKLKASCGAAFFISRNFLESDWCKKELRKCIEYDKEFSLIFLEGKNLPENYLEVLGFPSNNINAKNIDKKNHVFWTAFSYKGDFYDKMGKWKMLAEARENVNETPISKIITDFGTIKDISQEQSLQFSDKLYFGKYMMEANGDWGKIVWRVIAVEENKILLFSEYLLDAKHFHNMEEAVGWEECDLQKWLNTEFYENAFSEEEKGRIIANKITTAANWMYSRDGMVYETEVENRVFLLSAEELYQYFSENPASFYYQNEKFQAIGDESFLRGEYTAYAKGRTGYLQEGKFGFWWLRTSGSDKKKATRVTSNPTPQLHMEGKSVKFPLEEGKKPAGGVRPAIWIKREIEMQEVVDK